MLETKTTTTAYNRTAELMRKYRITLDVEKYASA